MTQDMPYIAPEFAAIDESGVTHRLSDLKGKWVVLFFYPKDDTPGCTIEACALRDARDVLADLGAVVVGISRDDAASHEKFKSKHRLNYMLLSDPEHAIMDLYGAWGKKMFGVVGPLRKTFIINPDGLVVKVYGRVTPLGHGEQIVNDLKSFISKY